MKKDLNCHSKRVDSYWIGEKIKISARNLSKGKVEKITLGSVDEEVVIRTTAGETIVPMITKDSVESLGLFEGKEVYAVIKASNVMVAVD